MKKWNEAPKYVFTFFDYQPNELFLLEFNLELSGWGCYSTKIIDNKKIIFYERTIVHFVIFRTRFSLRKKWSVYEG